MRILIVEHHDKSSVGVVGETLHKMGIETPTVWCEFGEPVPESHRDYDGIVILGGTMSAIDDEGHPYLPRLTGLIRDFADADKPVLGICLGSQLIARAFDAEAHIGGPLEFGFHLVTPTLSAESDPVMRHLERPQPLFQWHTDHYTLPEGAEHLAVGEHYENQAYRIGHAVYGMQFHFEVTEAQVRDQAGDVPDLGSQVPGYEEWLPRQFALNEEASNTFCRNVVRDWVALA
jgi:GMP synthase-like glutamine amidotransferase